jgi:hypothetical protein
MKTKKEMLDEMFKGTQFEKHIKEDMALPKANIERVYNYFVSHPEDTKRTLFCSTLLG